jgi:hypothetical protein
MPKPRKDPSAYYYSDHTPPWAMHAGAAPMYAGAAPMYAGAAPILPYYGGAGAGMQGLGKKKPAKQFVLQLVDPGAAHAHGHKGKGHKRQRVNVKALATANGIDPGERADVELLEELVGKSTLHLKNAQEFRLILSRYITKSHWVSVEPLDIATAIRKEATGPSSKFVGEWTPAALSSGKLVLFVTKALKNARHYAKKHGSLVESGHAAVN